jgi:carbon monoxide dehydrogenase subunit G
MPVIEQRASVAATPADVFAFLHDPAQRPVWDTSVGLCRLEGESVAAGARVHLRGRRKAPSWVGEYVEVDAPSRSVLRLVEGVGMPFADYRQTIEVAADGGRTAVVLRLEYGVRGPLVLIERFTFRGKLDHALQDSVRKVEMRFAE